ncbi:ATP-grasp domain-containing protein [Planotetraspora sp. A-T 1434]|uniref:acetyl-CoA carboxylase biotin carboxylase subunit n=1 Tax=Planotetraspora sp. A-T 1434 TaxID=2979219 RepID=UPI0021C17873|nr:biotin carboxylase N-terminal domain-containing protein [Planotetraspora sp. A-T 1434]MCT9931236.1 ATP-grasp domain-containing protein [Planotetraspora sp. A-T 1434]
MFDSVLVANRGEIARRIIRTVRRMGLRAIVVHSEADAELPFVAEADEAVLLGPASPAQSYLDVSKVIDAARAAGAQAVHPGYGFLAENAAFARAVVDAGLVWIGPDPDAIERMGDKINARNLMEEAGVPVAAGTREPVTDLAGAVRAAEKIGYPVMVKAAGGGGGIGMGVAHDEDSLAKAFEQASRAAARFGGAEGAGPAILLERYIERARHVEVQILGLADGTVIALGERDCSVQRRHQKVVEESPSPGITPELRARMLAAAVRAGETVGYRGAGTVECLVDADAQDFVFLEMNTRLQVEHPVTELVTGLDLVEHQIRIAAGEVYAVETRPSGHAIEFRVYAEDPKRFFPGPGKIDVWEEPSGEGVRVDSGYVAGNTVTPFYDPLMAKLCVHGATREEALGLARTAVAAFRVEGPKNNLPFCAELLDNPEFMTGDYDTGLVSKMRQAR